MKITIFLSIMVLLSLNTYSQIDSTALSNLNSQHSKSEIISKYRSLLIDNIIANDKTKTKELLQYILQHLDNENYLALYPSEKWIIYYCISDFSQIISESIDSSSVLKAKLNNKVKPNEDQLYQILLQKIDKTKDNIVDEIKSSTNLSKEDQEYLLLILKVYTSDYLNKNYQGEMNTLASKFIKEYPGSKFETYVRHNIRYEYGPKGFSLGMEFYSGACILNRSTDSYYKNGGVFGFGFIWGIGKFQINTRGAFVFSGLKRDINYNSYIWGQGERAQLFLPELSIGYKLETKKRISVSPILGFGWFSAAPYEKDKQDNSQLKNININSKGLPIIGIDFGWEFAKHQYYNYVFNRLMYAFHSCNIRYILQPINFPDKFNYMNGLSHNISISYKFGVGGAKRIY